MKDGFVAKHCGIVTEDNHMVHAQNDHGVVEVSLGVHWDRRVAGVFTFPGVR
jgi:cell wall-associated NlpC family hydrolase